MSCCRRRESRNISVMEAEAEAEGEDGFVFVLSTAVRRYGVATEDAEDIAVALTRASRIGKLGSAGVFANDEVDEDIVDVYLRAMDDLSGALRADGSSDLAAAAAKAAAFLAAVDARDARFASSAVDGDVDALVLVLVLVLARVLAPFAESTDEEDEDEEEERDEAEDDVPATCGATSTAARDAQLAVSTRRKSSPSLPLSLPLNSSTSTSTSTSTLLLVLPLFLLALGTALTAFFLVATFLLTSIASIPFTPPCKHTFGVLCAFAYDTLLIMALVFASICNDAAIGPTNALLICIGGTNPVAMLSSPNPLILCFCVCAFVLLSPNPHWILLIYRISLLSLSLCLFVCLFVFSVPVSLYPSFPFLCSPLFILSNLLYQSPT
mmetsp:Transcript_4564/g.8379  ORF Transcript_4564/g.8379 Transcript_4564/m.8379 type:complete len:381 (+) Transcript_4564:240-1382(+)